jgi:competence protein ComEA
MRDRILETIIKVLKSVRPIIFITLTLTAIFTSRHLQNVYQPPVLEPLVKIADAGSVEAKNETISELVISITGSVNKPGVYKLEPTSRVNDLVNKAGGFNSQSDKIYIASEINLARTLVDGEQIYIPSVSERKLISSGSATGNNSNNPQVSSKVNINSASKDELDTLPGVGAATADKIIAARPFTTVEDIQNVSGIGEATFAKLKDLITI